MGTEINQASVQTFATNMLTGLIALLNEHLPAANEAGSITEEHHVREIAEETVADTIWDHVPSWVTDFDDDDILSRDNVEDMIQYHYEGSDPAYDFDLVKKDDLGEAAEEAVKDFFSYNKNVDDITGLIIKRLNVVLNEEPA